MHNLRLEYALESNGNEAILGTADISEKAAEVLGYVQVPTKEDFEEFTERRWRYEKGLEDAGIDAEFMSYHELADQALENHLPYLVENSFVNSQLFHEGLEDGDSMEELFEELSEARSDPKNMLDRDFFAESLYVTVVDEA